jgi:NAD(P)-dependent dehydrogenase (short-subunit alcohol dehydrogenase family)
MQGLEGKTILVTGGSKGIGAAIVEALGVAGGHVVVHYGRDRAGAEAAAAAIPDGQKQLIGADLANTSEVDRLWGEALAWHGRVDVLVNNAAVMRLDGGIDDTDEAWDAVWSETLAVNVLAPSRLMRHAIKHFVPIGGGILVKLGRTARPRQPGASDLRRIEGSDTRGDEDHRSPLRQTQCAGLHHRAGRRAHQAFDRCGQRRRRRSCRDRRPRHGRVDTTL